jgi:hypothetical protein
MKEIDWSITLPTILLTAWGLFGLYSGIRNDGKSRFLITSGLDYLFDKADDPKSAIRIKNIVLGLLTTGLGLGSLYLQLK